MMNQRLCRLKCNDVQYYLLTFDKDGDLDLLLTDTVSAWHGHGAMFMYFLFFFALFSIQCTSCPEIWT